MATSETFELQSLEVDAPSTHEVLGAGARLEPRESGNGRAIHRFAAPAVRDVTVTVGRLEVVSRQVDGVRLQSEPPAAA